MARLVNIVDNGPMEVKPSEESKWVCMCGLSKNKPFCDGAHNKTKDEEAGKIYKYKEDGTREEL